MNPQRTMLVVIVIVAMAAIGLVAVTSDRPLDHEAQRTSATPNAKSPVPRTSTPNAQPETATTPNQTKASPLERAKAAATAEAATRLQIRERVEAAEDLDGRLEAFVEAVTGSATTLPEPVRRGPMLEYFLRMEIVQAELAGLAPAARADALARLRHRLGYSEPQIARLRAKDARQEARWANGRAYERARDALTARLSGDALELALRDLRQRHFGARATTIQREEDGGFYRFQRPRIYGRN